VASDSEEFDPRFDPAFQRGFDGPVFAEQRRPDEVDREESDRPRAEGRRDELESAIVVQLTQPSLKGNPWIVVLWVLGIGLSLAGLIGSWVAQSRLVDQVAATAIDYYVIPNVIQTLAPWAFAIGLAVIAAVAVLHATRWRP
jgi:hypothetical protein